MLTKKQIRARNNYIGASDVPIIMGLNKWQTVYDLWLLKTKRIEPRDLSDNQAVHFGNMLENVVAREFQKRNKIKVITPKNRYFLKDYPFMTALLDRVAVDKNILIEIKTTSTFNKNQWGEQDSDNVPEAYLVQVMTQMLVSGLREAYLAVLIGGNEYRQYKIEYSEGLADLILSSCIDFWQHVQSDTPPDATNEEDLEKMYSPVDEAQIESTKEIAGIHKILIELKDKIEKLKAQQTLYNFEIKEYMKENVILTNPEGEKLITWKQSHSTTFDSTKFKKENPEMYTKYQKTRDYRRFLVKGGEKSDFQGTIQ
jgi:putative phage-type endonuclease